MYALGLVRLVAGSTVCVIACDACSGVYCVRSVRVYSVSIYTVCAHTYITLTSSVVYSVATIVVFCYVLVLAHTVYIVLHSVAFYN